MELAPLLLPLPLRLLVLATILLAPCAAVAATFTVDTTVDDPALTACQAAVPADCSLRGALIAANSAPGPDIVVVPAGTYQLTPDGGGALDITDAATLTGAGAPTTVVHGASPGPLHNERPVFRVRAAGSVRIEGVTVQGGTASGIYMDGDTDLTLVRVTVRNNTTRAMGGGILVWAGRLALLDSAVLDNGAGSTQGGGIDSSTSLVIRNSTISGNRARGGAIRASGTVDLNNVTVTGNTSGLDIDGAAVLRNTILAGNELSDCGGPGTLASQGYNLLGNLTGCAYTAGPGDQLGGDPRLAPRGDYGGPTPTHALCTAPAEPHPNCSGASPALDTGNPAPPGGGGTACEATDQRGATRPGGSTCDIGAYERVVAPPPSPAPPTPPTNTVTTFTATLNATTFSTGQTMVLTATLTPGTSSMPVDVYLVVQLPDGTLISLRADRSVVAGLAPLAANLSPSLYTGELLRFSFTGAEPAGSYRWYTAVTEAGTVRVIGNVRQTSFTFSP